MVHEAELIVFSYRETALLQVNLLALVRDVASSQTCLEVVLVRVAQHDGVEDGIGEALDVDDLAVLDSAQSLLDLAVVADRFEDGTGAVRAHLQLMRLRHDNLTVKINRRHHALTEDDKLILVSAKVLIVLEEFLRLDEVHVARHDQDFAFEMLALKFLRF